MLMMIVHEQTYIYAYHKGVLDDCGSGSSHWQGHGHGREEEEEEEEECVWEDTALHAFSCLVSCPLQMYWYTAV